MNHEHVRETKDGEIFSHIVDFLALGALVPTFVHLFRLYKVFEAFGQIDRAKAK